MKDEVYSWRISARHKAALETEAGRDGWSLSQLLESITTEWLESRAAMRTDEQRQQELLHMQAAPSVGSIAGGDAERAERAMNSIRQRLRKQHALRRSR
jgi:hypothetical protein